jgi:crossover junction endodeoxyribonuclease RuvC
MTKKRVILGVDPGTAITGYGLIEQSGSYWRVLDFGAIKPPAKLKLTKRYLIIHQGIERLIDEHKPEVVSVESQYVGKNVMSAMKLGMARSVIMLAAAKREIPVFQYSPSKAKKAVVGTGSASKTQVQHMIQKLLGLSALPEPEDAADALALALCHAHSLLGGEEI